MHVSQHDFHQDPRLTSHTGSVGRASRKLKSIIEFAVSQVFNIEISEILGKSRGPANVALARQVAMYLARVVGGLPLAVVGREFGREFGRDRTTVAHACTVIESRRDDPGFNLTLDLLEGIVTRLRQMMMPPRLACL